MITCLATQRPFAVTTKLIISPYSGFRGFAIFSQMPTRLFVEMLPGWPNLRYVCLDVCVQVHICDSAQAVCVCVFYGWVGVCVERRNGLHKQDRAVGGWCQGPTPTTRLDAVSDSWLRVCRHPLCTVPPKGQRFNQLQSLDAALSLLPLRILIPAPWFTLSCASPYVSQAEIFHVQKSSPLY